MEAKGQEESTTKKHALLVKEKNLANIILSWSLDDILNGDLYKDQVGEIPNSFESVEHYQSSFIYPLLEEVRSEICSKMGSIFTAPLSKVISLHKSKQHRKLHCDVMVEGWKNGSDSVDKEPYRTRPGDIIAFTEAAPGQSIDLKSLGRSWNVGYVTRLSGDTCMCTQFEVRTSKELVWEEDVIKSLLCAVFVTNVTTNNRIWKELSLSQNFDVIKETLGSNSKVPEGCKMCSSRMKETIEEGLYLPSNLNKSQIEAVLECISTIQCDHNSSVKLVWGPPGTGKTGTLSVMLRSLLQLKCRTLICCPTNVAISEVASRVMKLVKDDGTSLCSLGDILLYGNIDPNAYVIEEICLNHRVERLFECLADGTGWKHCLTTMIDLLENCVPKYRDFCNSKYIEDSHRYVNDGQLFLDFIRERFIAIATLLRKCISGICTHLPKTLILEHNFKDMVALMSMLNSLENLLFQTDLVGEDLKEAILLHGPFNSFRHEVNNKTFLNIRSKCLHFLRTLFRALNGLELPKASKDSIEEFCFEKASMLFCTASSSYKLHSVKMKPMKLLVVDEAAQLRECELLIPLQVLGIKHAILLGDECQLPAYVNSKVSAKAGLGRSLFQRLSILGFSRHLLDTQYRMHPKLSSFPNAKFYQNRIMDAEIVKSESYGKRYLPGPMYGTYSFMNISSGREVIADGHSYKNMVEVAVLLKILHLLYKVCEAEKLNLTVGVISPYAAQVSEIQRKIGHKYDNHDKFKLHIGSIDGFQGSEKDVIIISTVRCNERGSIGFVSDPQRTNVALTRARHCLWILGNEETLSRSDSIWEHLALDAKARQCFFHADEDKDLHKVIMEVKKQLDQLSDMLNADSMFFRNSNWKLMFSGNFTKSFKKLDSAETKNLVLFFLSKLASGWRPKRVYSVVSCESSSNILKQYKIGKYYILCSVDIHRETWYMQILKIWDILPMQDIPRMIKRLDNIFRMYTEDYISRCTKRCIEGNIEVPLTWPASEDIVQFKSLCNTETDDISNTEYLDESSLEKSKVRESLLLMKFYSLSSGAINNLLSGCDGESLGLPFELTDQEREIVLFNKSSFILGRSGTGKTTVLTWKLFQNDQMYHVASEGYHDVQKDLSVNKRWRRESDDGITGDVLRQLFVTVSPKLCNAVRDQFCQLKRSVCGGDSVPRQSSIHIDVIDEVAHSADIPDSFQDLPLNSYPLIITFHKFMMMLDGTVGVSYFDRFPVVRRSTHRGNGKSRSITLDNFIRTKEITFERFDSLYWPHFSRILTRKLCSLTVFTEIMSVIKGSISKKDNDVGTIGQQEYLLLSNNRGSTLNMEKRSHVYKIFTEYEKRKTANGDFDLADLVIDLHRRLKDIRYKGDEMDFVFIDEVQDLTMRQISLFKYMCKNVDEGFAFSGDTAQTIAKGINFRFEDIRCLFYKEFLGQERKVSCKRNEKGIVSSLFHLNLNFRTHSGILKLAHSVIKLICHFFPFSIDFLNQETSLVSGEAPVLLETGTMDALKIIFEKSGPANGNVIAFGAEQVILVRDDILKKEICDFVGNKALVLTILECKGLEFQDVLLYNFFSSSPFENDWRVIYEYMSDNHLLGSNTVTSFPRFDMEKHGILCNELKQLYVAVTRTKQRLWICENGMEFCKPMFNYWQKLGAANVRKADDIFIKEMQVESSEEDWRSRGIKLFHEINYEMAMMCFERAGDTYWIKLSKASQCQAAARAREPNSEIACTYLRKAAEIFDEIGKAESAARLFFEINEYERAGCIYFNKLGERNLEKAGECFCLAKCFRQAAKVYANGRLYSKCLSACLYGELFEMGLQYVHEWRKSGVLYGSCSIQTDPLVQELLQKGAVHYYEKNEFRKMMKFVESFQSKDLIRSFLKDLKLLKELSDLEIRWGNFLEAAQIAKKMGNCLLEADLLSKGGIYREASLIMLWYVFSSLTRSTKGNYRHQFNSKDEILKKAVSYAKRHSDSFYEFVCTEAKILSEMGDAGEQLEPGLQFVRHWRQEVPDGLVKTSSDLAKIEQDLLQSCAALL
ncbi:hypothetical protein DCAR_0726978 [Daucus carota subsp. sativus]|uniref:Uncharacterized protein n=1 Tax=Daucus carota subsp. sativus TaxID=79200 RepID=A0A164SNI4_DAUCS|nr:hypothetical protein DCAR_0726978 [Daucus carota subsp. sativus]